MVDRFAITETLHRYAWALDENRYQSLQDVFSEDASFSVEVLNGPSFGPFTGLETIIAFFKQSKSAQTDKRRHVVSCIIFDGAGPTLQTSCYLTVLSIADKISVATTGTYHDDWQSSGGKWLIKKRHLRLDCMF
jgi:3-phenylpropionate/cinnamic acid dioxygenase small subunit